MPQEARLTRRIAGLLSARIAELRLRRVADPRRGAVSWSIERLLVPVLVGLISGAKSLADVERLTTNMSTACARMLGIHKRVPDTTMRDLLVQIDVDALRPLIRRLCRRAIRSKSLAPVGLPFGVVSMDGRSTATKHSDEHFAQANHQGGEVHHLLVRTITSALVSARAKVCLDMCPIPAKTNEAGIFATAFSALIAAYSEDVFQLIIYDAGACSKENGQLVEDAHRAYLFALKDNQPELAREAHRQLGNLGPKQAEATFSEARGKDIIHRRIWRTKEMAGWHGWTHLRTVIRIEQERVTERGERIVEQRYFVSSLRLERLTAEQWLRVVRCHWGVENENHWVYDAILQEDARPWIRQPQGMLVVMALRRLAFNILVIFRNVHQRSEQRRATPWRCLIDEVRIAMLTLTTAHIKGMRTRSPRALA